eukprot:TRINITY_DN10611_c0_g3_i2.p1 TRINITY_DN10611_c0_g3~~TRINITY_DN10611_c0_g3_i2.p1  ORF type:complete len:529 (+),score=153.08 TRINITY_DN10611_c0_g3_i2:337-1923(+)
MLVVIPTPIGNLRDISLRQYEAIHTCDVLAAEDTRTAGKLVNLLKRLRLTDPSMAKFAPRESNEEEPGESSKEDKSNQEEKEIDKEDNKESATEREGVAISRIKRTLREPGNANKLTKIQSNKKDSELNAKGKGELTLEQEEKIKVAVLQYYANKSLEVPTLKVEEEDVKELLNSTYFRKVLDSEDYDNRKKVLEYCQPLIEKKMEEVARNYDQERKLSYIMKRKPVFERHEQKEAKDDEAGYDEYQFLYGVDNEQVQEIREHIARVKRKKGRGLLVSLNAENERKRIPRLMKVMKLGFRVGLVSEAGTPSVSDPGAEFIRTATEEGVSVEALPGPCAALVGLVASGLQHTGFVFHGFLPKGHGQKVKILNHYIKLGLPVILYESFERIEATLNAVEEVYGPEHEVYLGAELTKMHERHHKGSVEEMKEKLKQPDTKHRGELTVVIGGLGYGKGDEMLLDDGHIAVDPEELGKILNDNIELPDREFKRIMRLITGLNQMQIGAILKRVRPRKRKIDEIDEIIRNSRKE